MIVDISYFSGDLHLAQRAQPQVADKIQGFINKYEPTILSLLLGDQMYALFKAAADPVVEPLDQRWSALLNGADFIDMNGTPLHWVGFKDKGYCLISAYIYFHYLRSEARIMVGSGAITPNTENATRVDVIPLQVHAWNDMVKLNVLLFGFLHANSEVYPEWKYLNDTIWHYPYNLFYGNYTYGCIASRNRHRQDSFTDLFYTINSLNL